MKTYVFLVLMKLARHIRTAIVAALIICASAVCYAQSCALCYTQAAGASHRFVQGLRTGILILIIPPVFMSVAITMLAYRKRNRTVDRTNPDEPKSDW
jgi:hypothetical protein